MDWNPLHLPFVRRWMQRDQAAKPIEIAESIPAPALPPPPLTLEELYERLAKSVAEEIQLKRSFDTDIISRLPDRDGTHENDKYHIEADPFKGWERLFKNLGFESERSYGNEYSDTEYNYTLKINGRELGALRIKPWTIYDRNGLVRDDIGEYELYCDEVGILTNARFEKFMESDIPGVLSAIQNWEEIVESTVKAFAAQEKMVKDYQEFGRSIKLIQELRACLEEFPDPDALCRQASQTFDNAQEDPEAFKRRIILANTVPVTASQVSPAKPLVEDLRALPETLVELLRKHNQYPAGDPVQLETLQPAIISSVVTLIQAGFFERPEDVTNYLDRINPILAQTYRTIIGAQQLQTFAIGTARQPPIETVDIGIS